MTNDLFDRKLERQTISNESYISASICFSKLNRILGDLVHCSDVPKKFRDEIYQIHRQFIQTKQIFDAQRQMLEGGDNYDIWNPITTPPLDKDKHYLLFETVLHPYLKVRTPLYSVGRVCDWKYLQSHTHWMNLPPIPEGVEIASLEDQLNQLKGE